MRLAPRATPFVLSHRTAIGASVRSLRNAREVVCSRLEKILRHWLHHHPLNMKQVSAFRSQFDFQSIRWKDMIRFVALHLFACHRERPHRRRRDRIH